MVSPPYTITSSPAGISGVMTTTIFTMSNIPFQNSYNILISGTGTCSGYGQVLYSNPTLSNNITVTSTNVSCYGGSDGSAVAGFPGTPPFSFQWSTGPTNTIVTGLSAGVYTVTISDSKGCIASTPFTINQPSPLNSQLATTLIPCFGGTISSAVTSTGGAGPYTYTVNGSALAVSPGTVATNLSVGVQTVTVKDTKGCLTTNTVLLNQAAQQIITPTITQPLCPKTSDGAISVTASGPVAGYSYSWHPGSSTSATLSNIPAGNYTLYLHDASNCITKSVIAVPAPPGVVPMPFIQKENCSAVDGAFTLNVSGGFPPYTYTTLPGNTTGSIVTGLSTGTYSTIIKDSQNCIDTTHFYVGNLSTVSLNILTVTPVQCYNTCNGSVILNVQNAVQPVTYSLTGFPVTTNSVISNLCAGIYIVKAIDNIGCPGFDTINFPIPPVFSYSATTPPVICIGGHAELKATALGGSGQLSYIWKPGSLTGPTVNVEPVVTTTYSLSVFDSKGCTLPPYPVIVNVHPKISININTSNAAICPGTTAQITPTVTGGDGNYDYLWSPGNNKGSSIFVENITIPTYTLTVNDACGSPTGVLEIKIKLHPVIQPLYKEEGKGGCSPYCTTFINTTPRSKNAIWNYGDRPFEQGGDTTKYCYDKAGSFNLRVTVTDSNSCKASYTYMAAVNVLPRPDAGFITNPGTITLNDAEDVLIKNTTDNATIFKWYIDGEYRGARQNINYSFKDTGCYDIKLIAENENHCVDSTIRSICVFEGFNFYMPRAFTPNNDGLNDVLLPKGTGWLYDNYKFEVYNRWGHKIFSTGNVTEGWDGGVKIDPNIVDVTSADANDVYAWRAVVTDNMQKEHELRGFVTLVR